MASISFSKADGVLNARQAERLQQAEQQRQSAVAAANAAYDGTADSYAAYAAAMKASDLAYAAARQESERLRQLDRDAIRRAEIDLGPNHFADSDGATAFLEQYGVSDLGEVIED